MDPCVGNAQFTGDVCHRLSAGLGEPHRLVLTFLHRSLVDFLHDPCPSLSEYFLNFHSSKLEEGGKIGERFLESADCQHNRGVGE